MERHFLGFFVKLWISVTGVTIFTIFILPILHFLLVEISYRLLTKAEDANEHVKSGNKFLKSLCWMGIVLLCSFGLLIFTGLIKLLEKMDVFHTLEEMEEDEEWT